MAKIGCDVICKSHSARSDRDPYRTCPTKLSKPELENLYFALLENNLALKKTVNEQQDTIKILSTKVRRITSTQSLRTEEKKDCCFATKALVNQQKDMITDLKRSNERMVERIRKLNMRLCSAKQFCKTATPRCLRCSTATSPYLIKNSPPSYKHHSQSTLKLAVSCQNLSRDSMITKCVQTDFCETPKDKEDKRPCEDNKCRTVLEELNQKIDDLNEKLSRTEESYNTRVLSLEHELHQSRGERMGLEHSLQHTQHTNTRLITSLRAAQGLSTELKTQLSIEKRKVAELETRLKASTISNRVAKSIEDTLASIQESNKSTTMDVTFTPPPPNIGLNVQQVNMDLISPKQDHICDDTKLSKSTDDSGYIDVKNTTFLDDQSLNKIIEDLSKRIVVLQTQVDYLTISPPERETEAKTSTPRDNNNSTKILLSSPKINLQSPLRDDINLSKEEVVITDNSINSKDIQTNNQTEPIPTSESTPKLKSGITKLNIVTKIIKANNSITENNKNNENIKTFDTEDKDTSSDKTYNVNDKSKLKSKSVSEKDEIFGKKDEIYVDEEMKVGNKEKQKSSVVVKVQEVHKNVERKRLVTRSKTLARSKTEYRDTSTCEEGTYTVEHKSPRPTSPDNTDFEISSMTDVSEEDEPKTPRMDYLSPGEQKYTNTETSSCTTPVTNCSLSEGEIPTTTVRRKLNGNNPIRSTKIAPPKMDETLQAITDELGRCKRLLFSSRFHDAI